MLNVTLLPVYSTYICRPKIPSLIVQESSNNEAADVALRLSTVQLDKMSASPPALKLPPLFSVTPNSSGKVGNVQKRHTLAQTYQTENVSERKSVEQARSINHVHYAPQGFVFSFSSPTFRVLV